MVENRAITLMGDYNIDYLNEGEQNFLDSVILPYGLWILNTNIPNRDEDYSNTLIDYIITDLNNSESFSNIISDTPLRTKKKQLITLQQPPDMKRISKSKTHNFHYQRKFWWEKLSQKKFSNKQLLIAIEEVFTIKLVPKERSQFLWIYWDSLGKECPKKYGLHTKWQKWYNNLSKNEKTIKKIVNFIVRWLDEWNQQTIVTRCCYEIMKNSQTMTE